MTHGLSDAGVTHQRLRDSLIPIYLIRANCRQTHRLRRAMLSLVTQSQVPATACAKFRILSRHRRYISMRWHPFESPHPRFSHTLIALWPSVLITCSPSEEGDYVGWIPVLPVVFRAGFRTWDTPCLETHGCMLAGKTEVQARSWGYTCSKW